MIFSLKVALLVMVAQPTLAYRETNPNAGTLQDEGNKETLNIALDDVAVKPSKRPVKRAVDEKESEAIAVLQEREEAFVTSNVTPTDVMVTDNEPGQKYEKVGTGKEASLSLVNITAHVATNQRLANFTSPSTASKPECGEKIQELPDAVECTQESAAYANSLAEHQTYLDQRNEAKLDMEGYELQPCGKSPRTGDVGGSCWMCGDGSDGRFDCKFQSYQLPKCSNFDGDGIKPRAIECTR